MSCNRLVCGGLNANPKESCVHEQYNNDHTFRTIVDTLFCLLTSKDKHYTPSDLRNAALLACEMYEYYNVKPTLIKMTGMVSSANGWMPDDFYREEYI